MIGHSLWTFCNLELCLCGFTKSIKNLKRRKAKLDPMRHALQIFISNLYSLRSGKQIAQRPKKGMEEHI